MVMITKLKEIVVAVRKIQINIDKLNATSGGTIDIPLGTSFSPIDFTDDIEEKFIKDGVESTINDIVDDDQIRYSPTNPDLGELSGITYTIKLIGGDTWGDIGFTSDDFGYQRNNIKHTFIKLSFYDSDNPSNGNKLFTMTLHPNVGEISVGDDIQFKVASPISSPSGIAEGFYLYYLKQGLPKVVYMKAEFNNAKTGFSSKLMTSAIPVPTIEELIGLIYTKYHLRKFNGKYIYIVDNVYSNNVTYVPSNAIVTLYETEIV